jgi:hypothetical protein
MYVAIEYRFHYIPIFYYVTLCSPVEVQGCAGEISASSESNRL